MIVVWKNTGHPGLVGKEVEFFKVSWDEENNRWIKDPDGPWWGIEHPVYEGRNIRLPEEITYYGEEAKSKEDISIPSVELGRPTLEEVEDEEE